MTERARLSGVLRRWARFGFLMRGLTRIVPYRYTAQGQLKASTRLDRYPRIMAFVRDYFVAAHVVSPRILSFGCSTGEESATLRTYFPRSLILGVDTNARALEKARRTWRHLLDGRLTFEHSSMLEDEPTESFDAIFCMAVLLRHPETMDLENSATCYSFEEFDAQATRLDRLIRPGGLLVIQNANFRFSEASASTRYAQVSGAPGEDGFVAQVAIFDRNNKRIRGVKPQTVFEKRVSSLARDAI